MTCVNSMAVGCWKSLPVLLPPEYQSKSCFRSGPYKQKGFPLRACTHPHLSNFASCTSRHPGVITSYHTAYTYNDTTKWERSYNIYFKIPSIACKRPLRLSSIAIAESSCFSPNSLSCLSASPCRFTALSEDNLLSEPMNH